MVLIISAQHLSQIHVCITNSTQTTLKILNISTFLQGVRRDEWLAGLDDYHTSWKVEDSTNVPSGNYREIILPLYLYLCKALPLTYIHQHSDQTGWLNELSISLVFGRLGDSNQWVLTLVKSNQCNNNWTCCFLANCLALLGYGKDWLPPCLSHKMTESDIRS